MRSGLFESQFSSPILYPLEIIVVSVSGGLVLYLTMLTLAQLLPVLPNPVITVFQVWLVPASGTYGLLGGLSSKSIYSMPVSAAKKASLVSLTEVPNFISFSAMLETPSAIAKRILERVAAKSITNPPFFLIFNFIFVIFPPSN